jgi:hypothetical protein
MLLEIELAEEEERFMAVEIKGEE